MVRKLLGQIALDPVKLQNKKPADLTFKDMLDSDPKFKDLL